MWLSHLWTLVAYTYNHFLDLSFPPSEDWARVTPGAWQRRFHHQEHERRFARLWRVIVLRALCAPGGKFLLRLRVPASAEGRRCHRPGGQSGANVTRPGGEGEKEHGNLGVAERAQKHFSLEPALVLKQDVRRHPQRRPRFADGIEDLPPAGFDLGRQEFLDEAARHRAKDGFPSGPCPADEIIHVRAVIAPDFDQADMLSEAAHRRRLEIGPGRHRAVAAA